jgi:hypothetical protein
MKQIRSGFCYAVSPEVREKLQSMGLILATCGGLAITDAGLRRIEAGE